MLSARSDAPETSSSRSSGDGGGGGDRLTQLPGSGREGRERPSVATRSRAVTLPVAAGSDHELSTIVTVGPEIALAYSAAVSFSARTKKKRHKHLLLLTGDCCDQKNGKLA